MFLHLKSLAFAALLLELLVHVGHDIIEHLCHFALKTDSQVKNAVSPVSDCFLYI